METVYLRFKYNVNLFRNQIFWSFSLMILSLCLSYAYFVNRAVFNIVERENAEKAIVEINSRIGGLESQYISLQKNIDERNILASDFVKVVNVSFVSRNHALGDSLSLHR